MRDNYTAALHGAYHPSRAIGETMERLDVLIALRKASESHATGKGENRNKGSRSQCLPRQTKQTATERPITGDHSYACHACCEQPSEDNATGTQLRGS